MIGPHPANEAQATAASDGLNSGSGGQWAPENDDIISRYIEDAYEKVPSIGEGHRWYDFPYKLLRWLSSSWPKKVLPRFVREWLYLGMAYLIPFNEHDLHKVWSLEDPLENVTVPPDEHVFVPGVWVVELFPPSEFASLEKIIERNSWDKGRRWILGLDGNKEMLGRSRSGEGWTWWSLAEIANVNSTLWFPDASRERLPVDFDAVELKAIRLGQASLPCWRTFV